MEEITGFLNIKRYNSQNINLHDIRELMINRGSLLILNEKILQNKNLDKKMKMVLIKHFVKAIIGYGDALLYLHGKYHWSYKRKKELMWGIKPSFPAFARIYDYAINFRFNPNYERLINSDLEMFQRFIVRNVEKKIHLEFERQMARDENLNWRSYFYNMTRVPFYSQKKNPINLLKVFVKMLSLDKIRFAMKFK